MYNTLHANGLKLHIRCRFKTFEHIVCDWNGNFYQLPFCDKRTRPFRKLNLITCGGSKGYRINRKFYTLTFLRKDCIPTDEWITVYKPTPLPF